MSTGGMRFDGKVAIVTGAGHGLGRAYAMLLAERGAKVLVNDLGGDFRGQGADTGPAEAVAAAIREAGGEALANGDTVATREGADSIVGAAMEAWGRVDILINNAGIVTSVGPISQMRDEQWDTDIKVAATGTFQMCRAVWDHMWQRGTGRILNISSGSFFGMGSGVGYPAAKGATWGITRALASAARHNGKDIKINCVMPTAASRMTHMLGEEVANAMAKHYPPEAAAPVAAFLVHDEVPVTGEMFRIGGNIFRRAFIGLTPGYKAAEGFLDMETVRDHFEEAMAPGGYIIPSDSAEALDPDADVNWGAFMQNVI
ncbi:MAG: SDR family NAD(P)-dependent oxidoreductase [Novosphingobium sp.]|nr:SDR family NAD(P)-dependent oxidoreductase [Novosphingobium sp.]